MRAKFRVNSVNPPVVPLSEGITMAPAQTITAFPVAASGYPADGSDENNTYAKWSPSGKLELTIVNPALSNQVKEGDTFYVDFTKVEAPAAEPGTEIATPPPAEPVGEPVDAAPAGAVAPDQAAQ